LSDKQKVLDEFKKTGPGELLPLLERGPVTLLNKTGGGVRGVLCAELAAASEEEAWSVLLDFINYPKFLQAVSKTKIRSKKENEHLVSFEAGVRIVGISGMVDFTYRLVENRPFLDAFNNKTGEAVSYWAIYPVEAGRTIVAQGNIARNIMEMSSILNFLVEKMPSAELGLRIAPVVMMVNDMKKQMEKISSKMV